MKNGFSATPTIQYNIGYPYSVGNLIAATVGPNQYANIPQVDFGAGVPTVTAIGNITGAGLSTNYYDPAYWAASCIRTSRRHVVRRRPQPTVVTSTQNSTHRWYPVQARHGNILGIQFGESSSATRSTTRCRRRTRTTSRSPTACLVRADELQLLRGSSQGFKNLRGCVLQVPNIQRVHELCVHSVER